MQENVDVDEVAAGYSVAKIKRPGGTGDPPGGDDQSRRLTLNGSALLQQPSSAAVRYVQQVPRAREICGIDMS